MCVLVLFEFEFLYIFPQDSHAGRTSWVSNSGTIPTYMCYAGCCERALIKFFILKPADGSKSANGFAQPPVHLVRVTLPV